MEMKRQNQSIEAKRLQAIGLATVVLLLSITSAAQNQQTGAPDRSRRTVLVSIPDRRLVVLQDGNVIA
jgi:hypothetical protein